jgi:hypothetical protein
MSGYVIGLGQNSYLNAGDTEFPRLLVSDKTTIWQLALISFVDECIGDLSLFDKSGVSRLDAITKP